MRAPRPFGQHARDVVGKSAAGDMRETFHRLGLADRGEARLHVNAGRREDGFAERFARARTAPVRVQGSPVFSTTLRTSE